MYFIGFDIPFSYIGFRPMVITDSTFVSIDNARYLEVHIVDRVAPPFKLHDLLPND